REARTPAFDQAAELVAVAERAVLAGVGLALVPDHTGQRVGLQRMQHRVVQQSVELVLAILHGHADLRGAELPRALQRPRRGAGGLHEDLLLRALDAAATAVVLHAHGQHVAPRTQRRCRDLVHTRLVVVAGHAADLLSVDP